MLRALGLTSELAEHAATADSRLGRVVGVSGGVATVLTEAGALPAGLGGGLLRAVAEDHEEMPCAGDWVLLRDWPDDRVTLERVLPRHGTLRGDLPGGPVLAANVDLVGVLVRPGPLPGAARLHRTLARAAASGAEPVLVLLDSERVERPDLALTHLARLAGLRGGHPTSGAAGRPAGGPMCCVVSTTTGAGLGQLRELVEGRTLALVGAQAADRHALCRALAGVEMAVWARPHPAPWLLPLPGGGAVLSDG